MPNWVNNDITIKGHPRTIQRLVEAMAGEQTIFDFNKVIPCPKELIETAESHYPTTSPEYAKREAEKMRLKEKYGHTGWYDWCVQNWGTKWNSCNARSQKMSNGEYYFGFETAWSPVSEGVMSRLSKRFPSLTFIYEFHEEAGMYPSERQTWKDGEMIDSIEIENTNITSEDEESA